jgi:hypothetical protein
MTTPLLLIPEDAATQNQLAMNDEQRLINQAIRSLEASANDFMFVDLSAGTTVLDFEAMRTAVYFRLINASAPCTFFYPGRTSINFLRRLFVVSNETPYTVNVAVVGESGQAVPPGVRAILYHDSNVMTLVASSAGGGGGGGGGTAGTNGTSFLTGNGAPVAGLGSNGDSYIDATNGELWKKQAGSWTDTGMSLKGAPGVGTNGTNGTNGSNGTNGTNGSNFLTGTGDPSSSLGTAGDTYLNTNTGEVWKKTGLVWGNTGTSLTGPGYTALTTGAPVSGHRVLMSDGAGHVIHADPSNTNYQFAGISTQAASSGATVFVALGGSSIMEPSWSWNPNDILYTGANGALTSTPPTTGVFQQVAVAMTPTTILVQPFPTITRS